MNHTHQDQSDVARLIIADEQAQGIRAEILRYDSSVQWLKLFICSDFVYISLIDNGKWIDVHFMVDVQRVVEFGDWMFNRF